MTDNYPEEQRKIDEMYMRRALELAAKGRGTTTPNPMVGAVIVKDGQILGEGYHIRAGEGHAEVNAFRDAEGKDVTGATIYVTLEPCSHYGKTPPCADKIVEKKIGRVVVAALDPNPLVAGRGIEKIRKAGIEVVTGVLAEESIQLNEVFMKYIVTKRPFVLLKAAMIAPAGGFYLRILFKASASFGISTGFAICPFIPASNTFCLSSSNAFAVIAIIGMSDTALSGSFRICLVASYPSICGI